MKNTNNTLPLAKPKNVGVFGNGAADVTDGLYFQALKYEPFEIGVLPVGGGSGTGRFSYLVPPLDAIKARVAEQNNGGIVQYITNNSLILEGLNTKVELTPDWVLSGGLLYPAPEVCLVFIKALASESKGAPYRSPTTQESSADAQFLIQNATVIISNSTGKALPSWKRSPLSAPTQLSSPTVQA